MGAHTIARSARERQVAALALGLRRFVQELRASSGRAERSTGLSGAQLFVLAQLRGSPAASLEELARRTCTHQSSASVVVSRLAARGLVRRERSRSDGRRTEIAVTPKGAELLARAPVTFQERLFAALSGLPRERLRELASGWTALEAALGLGREPAPLFLEPPPRARGRR